MFIKVHTVFFTQGIFYSISHKKQRKMEVFFFMMSGSCIGSQCICFKSKSDWNLCPAKMKFLIQFTV